MKKATLQSSWLQYLEKIGRNFMINASPGKLIFGAFQAADNEDVSCNSLENDIAI